MSLSDLTTRALQVWQSVPTLDVDDEPTFDSFNQPITELEEEPTVTMGRIDPVSDREGISVEGTRAIVSLFDCILDEPLAVNERDTIIDDESGVYDVLSAQIVDDATGPHHTELILELITA